MSSINGEIAEFSPKLKRRPANQVSSIKGRIALKKFTEPRRSEAD